MTVVMVAVPPPPPVEEPPPRPLFDIQYNYGDYSVRRVVREFDWEADSMASDESCHFPYSPTLSCLAERLQSMVRILRRAQVKWVSTDPPKQ